METTVTGFVVQAGTLGFVIHALKARAAEMGEKALKSAEKGSEFFAGMWARDAARLAMKAIEIDAAPFVCDARIIGSAPSI